LPLAREKHVIGSHGRFSWYELMTTDIEAAKAFYAKVVGWRPWDASVPGMTYTLFAIGETRISGLLNLPEDAKNMGARPAWLGYVAVNDVDAAVDRVERLGGKVYVAPTDIPSVSSFSVFADPQTAMLGVLKALTTGQAQPANMTAPGRVGWHELVATDPDAALAFYGEVFGWRKADAETTEKGTYQLFSAGGETIGGMLTKPATMPGPYWLYYFNVDDIDAATKRVTAGGGQIVNGPLELPAGSWICECIDPQGAAFALEGKRGHSAIGYFERVAPRDPSDARSRRWSW
jgi:predicted enzyme related to lactoylglutathione lyase